MFVGMFVYERGLRQLNRQEKDRLTDVEHKVDMLWRRHDLLWPTPQELSAIRADNIRLINEVKTEQAKQFTHFQQQIARLHELISTKQSKPVGCYDDRGSETFNIHTKVYNTYGGATIIITNKTTTPLLQSLLTALDALPIDDHKRVLRFAQGLHQSVEVE